MTIAEGTSSANEIDVSTADQIDGARVSPVFATGFDAGPAGPVTSQSGHSGGFHDDPPVLNLSRGKQATDRRRARHGWTARLLLLAGSQTGVGCLVLAHSIRPVGEAAITRAPSGAMACIAIIAGAVGIWLVPGLWLSALLMRTGAGPVARLATRIGTTLAWYALAGPVIHLAADGARVTPGGVIGVTVAATTAVSLGLVLGLAPRPVNRKSRVVVAALAGGICAQTAMWMSMQFFTVGVSYEHIRRLDWLIVLACGSLTAVGVQHRPDLPLLRSANDNRAVVVFLAAVTVTAVVLIAIGNIWSPAQRMPSTISVEQATEPAGTDVAFAVTAIGHDGQELIQRAVFSVSDDVGRSVPARARVVRDGVTHAATLLVELDPSGRRQLCVHMPEARRWDSPIKITVQEQISGVLVQAVLPSEWCAR